MNEVRKKGQNQKWFQIPLNYQILLDFFEAGIIQALEN